MLSHHHTASEAALLRTALKPKIVSASLYLSAFEILRESVFERFANSPQKGELTLGALVRSLRETKALDDADLAAFEELQSADARVRQEISRLNPVLENAHYVELISRMMVLVTKVESAVLASQTLADLKEDAVLPTPVVALQLIQDIIIEGESHLSAYQNVFGTPPA